MKPVDRQKMCSNCDGRIPYDVTTCLYCGAQQLEEDSQSSKHQSLQDSLTSLYKPPYSAKAEEEDRSTPQNIKKEIFKEAKKEQNPYPLGDQAMAYNQKNMAQNDQEKSVLWPILLLSIGANLFILGLLQLFFSSEGFLRLEWTSEYWYFYCLIAAPLLFFGFKKSSSLK